MCVLYEHVNMHMLSGSACIFHSECAAQHRRGKQHMETCRVFVDMSVTSMRETTTCDCQKNIYAKKKNCEKELYIKIKMAVDYRIVNRF